MWMEVEDRAAVVYDVEFVRAYATGGNVAVAQVAMEYLGRRGQRFCCPGW